jgi:hypothetical protein
VPLPLFSGKLLLLDAVLKTIKSDNLLENTRQERILRISISAETFSDKNVLKLLAEFHPKNDLKIYSDISKIF